MTDDTKDPAFRKASTKAPLAERPDDPPIVARMVIEIRSDGVRTIARGALEDSANGERVALEAHGSSPMALASSLAKSLLTTPLLASQGLKAVVQNKIRARLKGRFR